jgi:diguanylate cyclase (GGDEF)-like protein
MELKTFFRTLIRKWWVILPAFLVAFTATIVFTFAQRPVYEATATFLVTPNASFESVNSFVTGLDVLSRRPEIATTYAEVAESRFIKDAAAQELGLSEAQVADLSVDSELRAGTNILKITVAGNAPAQVRDFTNVVGAHTVAYVRELIEVYELQPLDPATLPAAPIRPNRALNIALGGILGLALGAGLAFLADYLQAPLQEVASLSILDGETGAYTRRYLLQRLREEMSRAKRNSYPLSLALMNVDQLGTMGPSNAQVRSKALRGVALLLKQHLREEDILARYGDTVFAVLLPDMSAERAKEILERLQTRVAWTPLELHDSGVKLNLSGTVGIATYQLNGSGQDELLSRAARALQEAETAGYGQIHLVSEDEPSSISNGNES